MKLGKEGENSVRAREGGRKGEREEEGEIERGRKGKERERESEKVREHK